MGQQILAGRGFRCITAGTEHHMITHGVGMGIHRLRRGGGFLVSMQAHLAEVMAEACGKEALAMRIEWAAGTGDDGVHQRGRDLSAALAG